MTPDPQTPPMTAAMVTGYLVLDLELPDRPPLAQADDYDTALQLLAEVQHDFYDQLAANGEGPQLTRLALAIAPLDATGTVSQPCHWAIINGTRPAEP